MTAVGVWKTKENTAVTDRRYNQSDFCRDLHPCFICAHLWLKFNHKEPKEHKEQAHFFYVFSAFFAVECLTPNPCFICGQTAPAPLTPRQSAQMDKCLNQIELRPALLPPLTTGHRPKRYPQLAGFYQRP